MTSILEAAVASETVDVEIISTAEMGRIVHVLREEKKWTTQATTWRPYRERLSSVRRFTDVQISAVLGMTFVEMDAYQAEYTRTFAKGWTSDKVVEAVVAFAKRETRWPTKKDFAVDADLPAHSTWSTNSGPWNLDRWLQETKNVRGLHPRLILSIKNVTTRQRVIEAAGGVERLIRRGGAKKIQKDDYGTLWEMPPEPETVEKRAVWLEVVNATETDGKREHFFLRVPPTVETAKGAVEWSFNIPTGELEEFAAET